MSAEGYDVVNLTPKDILIKTADGRRFFFPASGQLAKMDVAVSYLGAIDGVQVVKTTFSGPTGIPERDPARRCVYLVSSLVAGNCPGRPDVFSPDTGPSAEKQDGRIVSVRRLQTAYDFTPEEFRSLFPEGTR